MIPILYKLGISLKIHFFISNCGKGLRLDMQSSFFIFPAEKTFANFSLLESMSYGVVPIISNVPGTEKIVQDGENGIVCEFTKDGLETGMKRAM